MTDNPDVQARASEAVAKALAAAADAMAGVAHARSASNVEGRTVKDSDRDTTVTQGSTKHDSDINAEEAWPPISSAPTISASPGTSSWPGARPPTSTP